MMDVKRYTEANRRAWNEVTPLHQKAKQGRYFDLFKTPGYSCLDPLITAKLGKLDLKGKRVAQLCCNDGREVLSLQNLGAAGCVGFDISDEAITEARKLATHAGIACEFVRSDIYEIDQAYNNLFDLVYVSIGALGWMPELASVFEVASRLLKTGGWLLIYEQHPFLEMLSVEPTTPEPLQITNPYFTDQPEISDAGLDYWGKENYQGETNYWFIHTLTGIFGSILAHGLRICLFEEYPHDISGVFQHVERQAISVPMCYILLANKA
jgi:SAM-dependent methyltransferase